MKNIHILVLIWGKDYKEQLEKNLQSRGSEASLNLSIDIENFQEVPNTFKATLIGSPKNSENISNADLGEIIRLISQDGNCFVEITKIQIS